MFPILFELGPIAIPAWHTFYLLGAIAAYYVLVKSAPKLAPNVPESQLNTLYIICYLGGYFGARLLSIFVDELQITGFVDTFLALFRLGPMTFYGGAIGCALCGYVYVRWRRLPFAEIYDISIPAGLIALGLGRIGCFLNGDDFGKAVSFEDVAPWWSVTFPNLRDGVPRYPVQLISTVMAFLIAGLALKFAGKWRSFVGIGGVGMIATAAYANYRFLIEFWRGDPRGSVLGGLLTTSQFVSVCVLIILAIIVARQILRVQSAGTQV